MKIRPLNNYQLLGTGITLSCAKVYDAQTASNIPNHQERGLVFCEGILLDNTEYVVVVW
jgi:hypothetical protein